MSLAVAYASKGLLVGAKSKLDCGSVDKAGGGEKWPARVHEVVVLDDKIVKGRSVANHFANVVRIRKLLSAPIVHKEVFVAPLAVEDALALAEERRCLEDGLDGATTCKDIHVVHRLPPAALVTHLGNDVVERGHFELLTPGHFKDVTHDGSIHDMVGTVREVVESRVGASAIAKVRLACGPQLIATTHHLLSTSHNICVAFDIFAPVEHGQI